MVRTGSHAYIEYDFEEDGSNNRTYGANATPNKKFGLQDRVTSLTLTNNRINLPQLNNNYLDSCCGALKIIYNGWETEAIPEIVDKRDKKQGFFNKILGSRL